MCEAYPPGIPMTQLSTSGTSPGVCMHVPESAAWDGPGLIAGDRRMA